MDIKKFEVNPLCENCYVVSDDTKECVIIDCGCSDEHEWNTIKQYISNEGLQVNLCGGETPQRRPLSC